MWIGQPSGQLSLRYDGSRFYVSRNIGGDYWHVTLLDRQGDTSKPFNIANNFLYYGGDRCQGALKETRLGQPGTSQSEYAYQFDGEDVGALAHGNEQLDSIVLTIDGSAVSIGSLAACTQANTIEFTQSISAVRDSGEVIGLTELQHVIDAGGYSVNYQHTWQVAGSVGYFYGAMMPINNAFQETVFTDMYLGSDVYRFDQHGGAEQWVGEVEEYAAFARGLGCAGAVGVIMDIEITPETVDGFSADNVRSAAWQVNRGGSDQWSKMYFERVPTQNPVVVSPGEIWTGSSNTNVRVYHPGIANISERECKIE